MANPEANIAEHTGGLVESYKGYDPRIVFFYFLLTALFLALIGGLTYQQLIKNGVYSEKERHQNQRRVLIPGPRGNIYDREGRILVGNRAVFSVVLHVDELRAQIREERSRIIRNYNQAGEKGVAKWSGLQQLARVSLAQRYLDSVIRILHRDPQSPEARLNVNRFKAHFQTAMLLPFTLLDDLTAEDCARLLEELPVNSPLQVYASSTRDYPYGSAAAHTLGAVKFDEDIESQDFPGSDLRTFRGKAAIGRDGLERKFDAQLQGTPGGAIFRVDPYGFRIKPAIEERTPIQGKNLTTSIDIDLQQIAEAGLGEQRGAAIALDVATGEVLVIASKPDYNLKEFSPRATKDVVAHMNEVGAWYHNAIAAGWPPGSTFKILTSIAAMRHGVGPNDTIVDCERWLKVGNSRFPCYNGREAHGEIHLSEAIARSCDIFFYRAGELATPDGIAAEARRFRLDRPTGIELPNEGSQMLIPDPAWKRQERDAAWYPGDTANMAIGQGDVVVSPLGMACFVASVARGETVTVPTLLHDPNRPRQHTEPIGLTPAQLKALYDGMEGCTTYGTAKVLSNEKAGFKIPGIRIAGKTGTAQKTVYKDGKKGTINYAWFICFAPVENPQIAMAVVMEGDTLGEEFGGGANSAPIAAQVLKKYFEKKTARATPSPLLQPVVRQAAAR